MNKTAIKNFAIWARNKLIADIQYRAGLMGITANGIKDPLPQSTATMEFYDIGTAEPYAITGNAISQRKRLVEVIRKKEKDSNYATAYKYILEEVAYTWFNRLIAVRFMEVNDYLPSHIRVLSSESGKIEPDLVTTPFDAELNFTSDEKETVLRLKTENKLDELFRLLFIKQCNALNEILPVLFEQTNDYTELLLSLSVVDQEGVVYHLIHDIEEDNFNIEKGGQVEIIGWLYQYYISEKHEEVVDPLHGKVVNKEDVPAATQLFTTDWVVRYIIDNSLGRYWLERHPESKLKDSLKFFVSSKTEPLKTVAEEIQPQDLTVFDPCIGSGHFLLYAFEVLMKIYFECGYSDRDAVRLIVDNNLYGIDIDDRAVQLAYFSVMMKARSYDRRFLGRGIQPNVYPVVESNYLSKNTLEYIAEKNTTIHNDIQTLLGVFTDAKEYGSIIQIPKIDFDGIYARFDEIENDISLFKEDALSSYLPLVNVARTLSQKYTVVATNPPYLNKYDAKLKSYVQNHYKDYGGDLFSVFIYRNFDFCKSNGYSGLMTPNVWMFIKSYEKLRHFLLEQKCIVTLVQMAKGAFFKEATVDICSFVLKNAKDNGKGLYFRLEDFKGGMEVQRQKVEEAIANPGCGYFYEATASNFSKIPGSPVAYWVSAVMIAAFAQTKVNDYCQPRQGFATGDNERFIRLWYEINIRQANFEGKNGVENPGKWFPCNKGGEYRKWYGNNLRFVNWKDNGKEMKEFSGSVIRNPSYYFREGITWSTISSAQISMRYSPQGFLFESKGSVCFFKHQEDLPYIMAILNSKVVYAALLILAPTLDFHEGPIGRVPIIDKREYRREVKDNVSHNILSAKSDWDSYETSWDFKKHPLV